MDDRADRLQTSIFLTWLPLAVMWVIMAVEQPVVTAVVARMSDAERQLAAFGITFSLALFIEGPVVQMLAAGTALADSRENYRRILGIMHIIGWGATLIHAILCIPGIFRPFAGVVMGIAPELIEPAWLALLTMLPWTVAVGYRRLWQGVLIRYGRTAVIPVAMVARLLVSFLTLVWGLRTEALPGAAVGGLALSLGVIAGAVVAGAYARPVVRELPVFTPADPDDGTGHSDRIMAIGAMIVFYLPLALLNLLNLGARPLMQMGLARGAMPLESQAIFPVSMGYIFLYTSFSLSSQEVVISRLKDAESRRKLVRFNTILAVVLALVYILVAASPLWRWWFGDVSGLSGRLTDLTRSPLLLSFPVIPLSAFISLFRGALVNRKRTMEVTLGILVNVTILLGTLFVGVKVLPDAAISVVSASYAMAFIGEFLFLVSRRPLKEFR